MTETLKVQVNGKWYVVEVESLTTDPVRTLVDGHAVEVSLSSESAVPAEIQVSSSKSAVSAPTPVTPPSTPVQSKPPPVQPPPTPPPAISGTPTAVKMFSAPMPGTILSVSVAVGDQVVTGDTVCILEAMKMQQALKADWSGLVKAVYVSVGQQVSDGDPILELE
jgi:biotin carboxyl carrier protein